MALKVPLHKEMYVEYCKIVFHNKLPFLKRLLLEGLWLWK